MRQPVTRRTRKTAQGSGPGAAGPLTPNWRLSLTRSLTISRPPRPPVRRGNANTTRVAPSRTYRTRRRPDDDLAGRLQRTAQNLAGERIHNTTHQALQVHVDHVHRQAAASHTVARRDLLVQHRVPHAG